MPDKIQPWSGRSRWSIDSFRKDMDDLFKRFFSDAKYSSSGRARTMAPSIVSFSKEGNRVIRIDLPGVEPNAMEVSVVGHVLTIRASREGHNNELINEGELHEVSYGRFERSITLPEGVQSAQIKGPLPKWSAGADHARAGATGRS